MHIIFYVITIFSFLFFLFIHIYLYISTWIAVCAIEAFSSKAVQKSNFASFVNLFIINKYILIFTENHFFLSSYKNKKSKIFNISKYTLLEVIAVL